MRAACNVPLCRTELCGKPSVNFIRCGCEHDCGHPVLHFCAEHWDDFQRQEDFLLQRAAELDRRIGDDL